MNMFDRAIGQLASMTKGFKRIAIMRPTWAGETPEYPDTNMESRVLSGYAKNEILFRCISERANSAATPRLLVRDKKTKTPLPDHPLQKLLDQPNSRMSAFDFWNATIIYEDLSGKSYWEQVRSAAGNTVELWPLRPDRMEIVPDPSNLIKGYNYLIPDMPPEFIPVDNVLEFTTFDPLSLYHGIAPAGVAMRSVSVDNSETDYLKLFFQSGGMPPGLLKTKKKLIDTDVTDIRRRWRERYGGFKSWIEPAVLDMDAEFQKTGFTFEEMGFDVLDARSEIRICMALKVPPILIGARVGLDRATYANYREARTAFWEDTMMPISIHHSDTLQRELANEEWGDIELYWNFDAVPVLYEKRLQLRAQYRADFLAGGMLLDEYRELMGYGPLPENTGKVRVQSLAYQIIKEGEFGVMNPGYTAPAGVGDTKVRKMLTKSPACRQKGETVGQCVSRKIPEIMDENPGMSQDQAIAIAESICSKRCGKKEEEKAASPTEEERKPTYDAAVALSQSTLDATMERLLEVAKGNGKGEE